MVYLTGAGPGNLDLLTIKALRVIKEADVIIYDKLINFEILDEAKSGCRFIYVGKSRGLHALPQEQINETIYQEALKHQSVVRLKGGDPLVFGRGSEEALYLKSRGVEFEFIPGITSAIAAPTYAGIPVTHRGVAVSFRVITAHESSDKLDSQIDWDSLRTDETLIFLMGVHRLEQIVTALMQIGKPSTTPLAIISRATFKDQNIVVSTLQESLNIDTDQIARPALIVVGEVVRFKKSLAWYRSTP